MIRAVFFDYDTIVSPVGKPQPGADAFIRACAERFPLLVTTSIGYATTEKTLKVAGLASLFLDILSAAEVEHPKPAPDLLFATLGRIGFRLRDRNPVEPRECLVVESSVDGIEAAHRAQMPCLAIANSARSDQLADAELIRDGFITIDLDEILRALR